ncbi:hypothetical protein C0993_008324 [Termitomyces sp. T159_Od127]|nr:hypothetical protein C0993_008324 [Termitomyces sp. T159_Od127]
MTSSTDLLPSSQRATAIFRALPFNTTPLLDTADLRELSDERQQLKNHLGLLHDEESRDYPNSDTLFAMFTAVMKGERIGQKETLAMAFPTVMRYRIIDIALFKDGKAPLRAPTQCRELQHVKLPTLSKLPIDKLMDMRTFLHHAKDAITSTPELPMIELESPASALSSERLFTSMCKRSKGRAMNNVFLNVETAAFHLKFLLEGHADLPDTKEELERYFRQGCKTDNQAWSSFKKKMFELKGPLYIAMAVSPLMLLATRNLQNNPPGKETLFDFWRILGQYERPISVLDAERELWSAIWDIAGGMDTSHRLQKALNQILISDFEDVKDWRLYRKISHSPLWQKVNLVLHLELCQVGQTRKIGNPSNAQIDHGPFCRETSQTHSHSGAENGAESEPGSGVDKSGSGREESGSGKDKSGSGTSGVDKSGSGAEESGVDKSGSGSEESDVDKSGSGSEESGSGKDKSGSGTSGSGKDKSGGGTSGSRKSKPGTRKGQPGKGKRKPGKSKPGTRKGKPEIGGMNEEGNSGEALIDEVQSEEEDVAYLGIAKPKSVVLRDHVKLSDLSLPDYERQRKKLPRLDIRNGSPVDKTFSILSILQAKIDQSIEIPEEQCLSTPPRKSKLYIRHRSGTLLDVVRSVDEKHPKALNALDIPPCISKPFPHHGLFSDQIAWDTAGGKVEEGYPTNDMRWSLAATAWAHHKWHMDSDGFATFIKVDTGSKIWFIGTPKRELPPSLLSGGIERILGSFDLHGVNSDILDIEAVVLTPNDLFFMRPNTLHAVVTPVPTVVHGGHFYATASIRATCYGIYDDFVAGLYITNISHSAASNLLLSRLLDFYFHELTTNTGDEGQISGDISQEGHCPDLENFQEVIDLFTFLHLIELSNVISYWNYKELTTPSSVESRLRAIKNRRVARKLKQWFFARYSLDGLDPTVTADEILDHKFLAQQAKALLNYKTLATEREKDKDGVEGIIITGQIDDITPEVLDQAIRDCLANTRAYDYYIESHVEICTFAWCEPDYCIKKRGMDELRVSKDTITGTSAEDSYLAGLTFGDISFFQRMEHEPRGEEREEESEEDELTSSIESGSQADWSPDHRKRKQRSADLSSTRKNLSSFRNRR